MSLRGKDLIDVNLIVLSLMIGSIALAYHEALPASLLFLPPPTPITPIAGLLTHSFQFLCCVPPIVCAFTVYVLDGGQTNQKTRNFLLFSTLVTGIFAINEIYRIHIILLFFGIAKTTTIGLYALGVASYGIVFWRQIRETAYPILLLALALLAFAIGVDLSLLKNFEIASLVEGIPKLLSGLNLALYFWDVCAREVAKTLDRS